MYWSDMSGSITEARLIRQGLDARDKLKDIQDSFKIGQKVKIEGKDGRKKSLIKGIVIDKTKCMVLVLKTKNGKQLYPVSFQYTQFLNELVVN